MNVMAESAKVGWRGVSWQGRYISNQLQTISVPWG